MKTVFLLPFLTIVQTTARFIIAFLTAQLILFSASAYVLPLDTILSKTTLQVGTEIISVEQNVIFKEGTEEYVVQENWLIEGDKNLKLTATGVGELKDLFSIHYLYNNKKRTHISEKNKIVKEVPSEFFERFLVVKSADSYRTYLKEQGISSKVRLSRAGGAICFAIGEASNKTALSPQVWIDQDFFHLNKIRFATEADVEFSDYKDYGKENTKENIKLHYPMTKQVSWSGKTATVKVTRVSIKNGATIKNFYSDALEGPSDIQLTGKGSLGQKITEFYTRFR